MIKWDASIKSTLRIVVPLSFSIVIIYLLYKDTQWQDIRQILLQDISYSVLALSLVFGLIANVIRGLRWHLLVQPIIPKGEREPRKVNAILTVLGSYTINMGIPRAGELWRCAEYKRYEQLTFSSLLGTLINDRISDIICLGLILLCIVLGYQEFFVNFFVKNPEKLEQFNSLLHSPYLYLAFFVLLLSIGLFVLFLKRRPKHKVVQISWSVIRSITSILHLEHRGLFVVYSLLIWLCYFLFFYTAFFAFPFTRELPISAGLIAFALSSLGVLAPVQAGIGPWHFMVISTLSIYHINYNDASIFALIVHSIQTLWISLVGLVAIIALPFINSKYSRQSSSEPY